MHRQFVENALQLWGNPLFLQSFLDFYARMQMMGLEAAREYWTSQHRADSFPGNAVELFERMIEFYSDLGFVSKRRHDEALKENERLKRENEFLKTTLRELNLKVFSEGSRQAQEMWTATVHKHMEVSAEIAKNFLDLFKPQTDNEK